MRVTNVFADVPFRGFFQSLLPDFILSFVFFTALVYAVLAKRFDHQRSAAAMSGAIGLAFSVGLVWWEHQRGWSIKNLGPLAIGFAVILLAMIMFQSIKQTGGSWAGAGIAFGASILVAWVLGFPWPVASEIMQILAVVALTVGILAFLLHSHGVVHSGMHIAHTAPIQNNLADIRHDMSNLYDDNKVGRRLQKRFGLLRQEGRAIHEHPEYAVDMMTQLKQMLPAEGWLTQRLSKLRERIHLIKKGHLKRIDELKDVLKRTPPSMRGALKKQIHETVRELGLDKRLERLDKAVAENEKRIKDLTQQAQNALASGDYQTLEHTLKQAQKQQAHNDNLFKTILRTEKKLSAAASHIEHKLHGGR